MVEVMLPLTEVPSVFKPTAEMSFNRFGYGWLLPGFLLHRNSFSSSDRILLPPEGGFQSFPNAAFGFGFFLHCHHCFFFFPADLSHQSVEHIINVITVGSRSFKERTVEFSCQSRAFFFRDLKKNTSVKKAKTSEVLPFSLLVLLSPELCAHPPSSTTAHLPWCLSLQFPFSFTPHFTSNVTICKRPSRHSSSDHS